MAEDRSVQLLDTTLIQKILSKARKAERRRTNFNFHHSLDDNPHRFLNVMLRGTFITPHRHLNPPKSEAFIIIQGLAAFFIFEDDGQIKECQILDHSMHKGALGIDIGPGVWHSLVVLSSECICYEVKPGPYKPDCDKEFSDWAPHEGSAACEKYLKDLEEFALKQLESLK